MPKFTQDNRPLALTTPLGKDVLLLERVTGHEALSQPFEFDLQVLAHVDNLDKVVFENILGREVSIRLAPEGGTPRYLHGMVNRFTQVQRVNGPDGPKTFVRYRLNIVPKLWLLSKKVQSRIFQQKGVDAILKEVLTGITTKYELSGTFESRDYCTQYRESDLAFAQRLMEEEGIFFFFKHTESGHEMVIANAASSHPDVQTEAILFEEIFGGDTPDERVNSWIKKQEIRSGKMSLGDYTFEKATEPYLVTKPVSDSVAVGEVTHKLKVANNDTLEIYDHPGRYAQRFDGVAPGGGDRAADIGKISTDSDRTTKIRLEEETVAGLRIEGGSDVRLFSAGFKFKLDRHFNANGSYVLTRVEHSAHTAGTYTTTSDTEEFAYENTFHCIPAALPYRPERITPKSRVDGTQTATVVGPSGEEIFTDKYGRVKVQFHWDRQGKKDADSSCWVRVGTIWAGQQWGSIHIPRIGQEVIVAYEEGDPDQPIIVGSVYNATNMPPYTLPDNKTQSGIKSRSSLKGTAEFFNELRFEDKKDSEDIYFHAQKDFHRVVEKDDDLKVGQHQTIEIQNNRTDTIKEGDEKFTIEKGNRFATLKEGNHTVVLEKGNQDITLKNGDETQTFQTGKRTHKVQADDTLTVVQGNRNVTVQAGNQTLEVSQGNHSLDVKLGNITIKAGVGSINEEATTSIEMKVGGNSIKIDQSGITIKGIMVNIQGSAMLEAKSPMTTVKGDGMLTLKGGVTMIG